eukprot:281995-Chlamydomonas_euryale.AAC.2
MYDAQQPFTLDQARAVAASLNSLVFHTYLPKQPPVSHLPTQAGALAAERCSAACAACMCVR